ncbi:3'-5' exonuclease [Ancylomarina euxinus]|uniref:3'-5' exonuclease n=1 Tax=Ancylomarina euxinus TaxID=2283627 RepID=A0A425XY13_9BACT|nr:3'-5' exonuclease [Ancylomarina euxinus]MCZ4695907.1 3'-5' exonuclease [Ancylomarina euxinus]MUP16283.1 3'-5' exonuclease [Ancylomarina euxinus]RRG19655.1 3'-5' exonuclease [Ancylomarina euxinus]
MLDDIKIEDLLFVDIETVSGEADFDKVSPKLQDLWEKKSNYFRSEEQTASDVYPRAGIYAEFGKIVCISTGVIVKKGDGKHFIVKSYYGHDEKQLLADFREMLDRFCSKPRKNLCAHNGKEFDFPYIARRMLINGLKLPNALNIAGKKPWEIRFIDTMELWKFGDYKHYTSLALLCEVFNIPTPKDDIDGSMVGQVYWGEDDLERIAIYCEKDILATAQLFLRYKGEDLIPEVNFERVLI